MGLRAIVAQTMRVMEMTESNSQSAAIVTRGQALVDKIAAWEVHVPQPPLPDDIQDRVAFPSRLLSTQVLHVMRAIDQDPPVSAGSELRAQELIDQWAQIEADVQEIIDKDLRELNTLLSDARVPHIAAP